MVTNVPVVLGFVAWGNSFIKVFPLSYLLLLAEVSGQTGLVLPKPLLPFCHPLGPEGSNNKNNNNSNKSEINAERKICQNILRGTLECNNFTLMFSVYSFSEKTRIHHWLT